MSFLVLFYLCLSLQLVFLSWSLFYLVSSCLVLSYHVLTFVFVFVVVVVFVVVFVFVIVLSCLILSLALASLLSLFYLVSSRLVLSCLIVS